MIRKVSFIAFFLLILILSVTSIQAADVDALDSGDDSSLKLDEEILLDEIDDGQYPLQENVKNQTIMTEQTSTVYYNGNYQVTLSDQNTDEALADKNVSFSINNADYQATTDSNGIAGVNIKLSPGTYPASAFFAGDDAYGPSNNISGNVKVLTTIKASDVTKYYKGTKTYQATYLDSLGNPLKNKKVSISVNGKKYTKTTNNKGLASFAVNFKPGTYKITTSNPSTGEQITNTFKILTTVTASNLKKVKGDSKKFTAKFYKSNGNALAKKTVKVKIKGKTYKYKTDSKGQLKLSFNSFKKGTYKVICYNNDGLSKTSTVQILSKASTKISVSSYLFMENENKEIKIKFSTALDDSSKAGKKITVYVDWEPYTKKTDSNGEIRLKLPISDTGRYEIECYYDGNKFFKSSYATAYVSVIDTPYTDLSVESETLSFGDYAGTPLQVEYTAGEVPLAKKTVCFTVNGKDCNVTTDSWGIASFPIKLAAGNYTVNYRSFDDSKVMGTSGSCNITVFKRTDTKLACNFKSSLKDSTRTLKVRLTDSNGNPIKYATVELYIDGEPCWGEETDSKGYASFYVGLSLGKYKVSAKFKGNNKYTSSSTSKSISVTISKYKNGINEKKASASSAYLKGSKNAPTNNKKIKSLVKSLTKGLTSPVDKARAIFHYVRDNIQYDYYYGTKHGAAGTLKTKKANCVDQSHLLTAMFRTAGLKTRYVQGVCTYSDGTFAHYWTQVLLDKTWVCADPVGHGNELGQINDWNTKTFKLKGKYLNA